MAPRLRLVALAAAAAAAALASRGGLVRTFAGIPSPAARRGAGRVQLQAEDPSAGYKDQAYWDTRYKTGDKGTTADQIDDRGRGWLCEYAGPLQQTLQAIAGGDPSKRIMNVGCGMDRMSEDIYADGFTNLVSTDISPTAIEAKKSETAATMPNAEWAVDDAMDMQVPANSIDIIVDKGTLDAVLILENPFLSGTKMLREVQRVLKPGGTYLLATHGRGDPDAYRLPLLTLPHLNMNIQKTPDLGGYYLFVCTKLGDADPETWTAAELWARERDDEDRAAEWAMVEEIGQ